MTGKANSQRLSVSNGEWNRLKSQFMSDNNIKDDENEDTGISGIAQKIIGEVELIGGILTGDPNTAAEGEFNLEVGDLREEVEEDLEESE